MDFPSMRRVEAYEPPIGAEALARICRKPTAWTPKSCARK
jgi:hypothetical protein